MNIRLLHIAVAVTVAVVALAGPSADPEPPPAATAAEQAHRFIDRLAAGDVAGASALLADLPAMPAEARAEIEGKLARMKRRAVLIGHLRLEHAAVAIVLDRTAASTRIDLDPVYLIRQDRRAWRVMPGLDRFEVPGVELDPPVEREFERLADWFDAQKPSLVALLGGARDASKHERAVGNAAHDLEHFLFSLRTGSERAIAHFTSRAEMTDGDLIAFYERYRERLESLDPRAVTPEITMSGDRTTAVFRFEDGPTFVLESTEGRETFFLKRAE